MSLTIIPLTWRQGCEFVAEHHRHNKPPRGCKWSIGVVDDDGILHGVALCGRPIARWEDDGLTIEVNRTCTDGTFNANSMLYGACWRISVAMGYRRMITYTQGDEDGASLRAAGMVKIRTLQPRGNWAASSKAQAHLRDPDGPGDVERALWGKSLEG